MNRGEIKNFVDSSKNNKRRIAVFVDAGNLWESYKTIGKMLDFGKFDGFFSKKFNGTIYKIFYFCAFPKEGTRPKGTTDGLHRFFTFLKKELNFCVRKKPLKTIYLRDKDGNIVYNQKTGEPESIEKGNLDVEVAIDSLRYATAYDIAIFMTGDSDFLPIITYLRTLNTPKEVYVFSTKGHISDELRTGSDGYFDIANCTEIHGKILENKK